MRNRAHLRFAFNPCPCYFALYVHTAVQTAQWFVGCSSFAAHCFVIGSFRFFAPASKPNSGRPLSILMYLFIMRETGLAAADKTHTRAPNGWAKVLVWTSMTTAHVLSLAFICAVRQARRVPKKNGALSVAFAWHCARPSHSHHRRHARVQQKKRQWEIKTSEAVPPPPPPPCTRLLTVCPGRPPLSCGAGGEKSLPRTLALRDLALLSRYLSLNTSSVLAYARSEIIRPAVNHDFAIPPPKKKKPIFSHGYIPLVMNIRKQKERLPGERSKNHILRSPDFFLFFHSVHLEQIESSISQLVTGIAYFLPP